MNRAGGGAMNIGQEEGYEQEEGAMNIGQEGAMNRRRGRWCRATIKTNPTQYYIKATRNRRGLSACSVFTCPCS